MNHRLCLLAVFLVLPLGTRAEEQDVAQYSPYADRTHATEVFWGDTHVHSSWSPDAGAGGNTSITPERAYQFARGDTITAHNGTRIALRRPLDFLVVSDHSEYMGIYPMLEQRLQALLATEAGARWAKLVEEGKRSQVGAEFALGLPDGKDLIDSPSFSRTVWDGVIANAERYNDPGRFTTFIGYEWTSMPAGANLHRVVLFSDGAAETSQVVPFRSIDSSDPEKLWAYLSDYERETGGRVMAIPHNSNMSAGRMFELHDYEGKPLTKEYAAERMRWERIAEATQIKGDSETAPFSSPEDEFADFGTWDARGGMAFGPHEDSMYDGEYIRPALGNGLVVAQAIGVNPFEFGLIGSTDAHTGLATADDDDFWGKFTSNEPHAGRASEPWAEAFIPPAGSDLRAQLDAMGPRDLGNTMTWELVASGFAAVWARENTRDALFDAMSRRETYATTGPRMTVRFFGGWNFEAEDAAAPDLAAVGYAKGTPMGGHLAARPGKGKPSFLVSALRDPEGANLDRIQIVKQWVDGRGMRRERIFDVAVSDGRKIGKDGRCRKTVGNTVQVGSATYTNTIGAAWLSAAWQDPDFDPKRPAVYYVRVLQIPTPSWTTYDAARFGTELIEHAPVTLQQRAYTSPIWYNAE
jgi:hypothetical protein